MQLTPLQKRQILHEARLELARRDFYQFRLLLNPDLIQGWFQKEVCLHLQEFAREFVEGKKPSLVIEAPPQMGKSIMVTEFIAWLSGKYPDTRTIYTSFSSRLGIRANRKLQLIFDSNIYKSIFPSFRIPNPRSFKENAQRNKEIIEFSNTNGYFRNTTVEGSITGESLDLGVIDDPIRGRRDANSVTKRDAAWNWFTDDFFTRFSEKGAMLAILTRWHIDDPIGRLIDQNRDVKVLKYKAIAEQDEPNRKAGEALFPEHKSIEFLLKRKQVMAGPHWLALYQQSPIPDGGTIFKRDWIQHWYYNGEESAKKLPKKFDKTIISVDCTFKDTDGTDFVVMQCWGKKDASFYLLDQIRGRWGFTETLEKFKDFCSKWPKAIRKIIEDKANGPAIIDAAKKEIVGIVPITPKDSKEARAHAVTTFFEAGNVYLPPEDEYPWVKDYITELLAFPGAVHDDQVDATTQALQDFFIKSSIVEYFMPDPDKERYNV